MQAARNGGSLSLTGGRVIGESTPKISRSYNYLRVFKQKEKLYTTLKLILLAIFLLFVAMILLGFQLVIGNLLRTGKLPL